MNQSLVLSVDAMGGDDAPEVVVDGLELFLARRNAVRILLHGDKTVLQPAIDATRRLKPACEICHTTETVSMDDKPSQAIRKRSSSMWNAIEAVRDGQAQASVSAGNTGALMAISMLRLSRMKGVYRPAMTALWPTRRGRVIVLDVGATLEADADQLLTFAIMGEAYARAIKGKPRPAIGILNVGAEDRKGHEELRRAAELIRESGLGLNYKGFVEGHDISEGAVDVVVTDGFSGNVALKTAEGTARLVAGFVRDALTSSMLARIGAVIASGGLRQLKERMDPSSVNGGVLLGLNGVSVKSHGGTDAKGFATALGLAADLALSPFREEVAASLRRVGEGAAQASESAA